MPDETKSVGRPPIDGEGTVRKRITITPSLWQVALKKGDGNASKGIRDALRECAEQGHHERRSAHT